MRAIGYFSERALQEDEAAPASLSEQNDRFLHYCEEQGYEPAAAFLDPAGASDRPGFQQLLQFLDEPEKGFVTVVVSSLRHLGPTRLAAARSYFQLTSKAAQVVSLDEGALDDAHLLQLWSESSSESGLSEKVRDAMRRRAVQGRVLGRPPYGYAVGSDRRLEVVEHEAEVVRHIFRLSLDGLGIRRIAKRLNAEGYRTRRGGRWSMVTIRELLRNRVYLGTYSRFGVKVPGNHPALVREADFRAVQEATERRRTNGPAQEPAKPSQFLLSGLVYCSDTNSKMIGVTRRQSWTRRDGEVARKTYRYYQSEARTNQSVGDYHTRRAADLEADVLRHLTGEAPGAVSHSVLNAGDALAVETEIKAVQARVQSRTRAIERRLQTHLDRAARGGLPADEIRRIATDLVHEYQQAQDELAALQRRRDAQTSERERRDYHDQQLQRIRTDWSSLPFDQRQALLRDVVERVVVDGDDVRTVLRA